MLDVLAAFLLGTIVTTDLIVLVGLAPIRAQAKLTAFVIAAGWTATMLTLGALGDFAAGTTGPVPTGVLAFAILVTAGLGAWVLAPRFRSALLSLPLAALIGVSAFRIGGVLFLILWNQGRLSAPFAPSAGWGDIITGVVAIPLAFRAARDRPPPRAVVALWNAFGALDLIVAISLGFFSAPGTPFRIFTSPPGTVVLTTVPYIAVPTILVPLYLLTHLTIAARLRSMRPQRVRVQAPARSGWAA
jgi:hypothetical protein